MIRLAPFLKPYFNRFMFACMALVAVHVIEALAPLLLRLGVDRISRGDGDLALPVGGILTLTAARYTLLSFGRRQNALVSVDLAADLRIAIFSHLQRQGSYFFARYALGDLVARATSDVDAIRLFFRAAVNHIVSIAAVLVVAPVFMFFQSPELTLVVIILLILIIAFAGCMARRVRRESVASQTQFAALVEDMQRNFHGLRTIQSHAAEDREIIRFAENANRYADANVTLFRSQAIHGAFLTASAGASALLVAGIGGAQASRGELSLGALIAFIFYSGMILGVLGNCAAPVFSFLRASTACARIFAILEETPEIHDGGESLLPKISGAVKVENLTFRYADGVTALKDVSFEIAPGELIVIHGRVGAGKTTLLRLLSRRLELTEGRIEIDGADARAYTLQQLRGEIAFVAQDTFLFAAPFDENISYDDPERPEDLISAAAATAALTETIRAAPLGLATLIGERGVTLSGGQKQRTALARGLIREAPLLLLDDCFSALDAETEAEIFGEIRRLRRGLTTIVVTHRVSSAQYADKVFILDKGELVESGPPDFLRAAGGKYAELCARHAANRKERLERAQ